jgi:predicted component of type VI protein secretion system
MPAQFVALDEGPDLALDQDLVVGRHPSCDARLDSLRVSRRHCRITREDGEIVVRDLGSTNGIRINGQRVDVGRLQVGDELSIAHLRYLLVEDFPDQGRAVTPPRDPSDPPPDVSTAPWIWVRHRLGFRPDE